MIFSKTIAGAILCSMSIILITLTSELSTNWKVLIVDLSILLTIFSIAVRSNPE